MGGWRREGEGGVKPDISHQRLLEIVNYDPITGIFTNKARRGRCAPGAVLGSLGSHRYIEIRLDDKLYLAHRLAHFYMTGGWPPRETDHKNLNRQDNSWDNIRAATNSQNQGNKPVQKNNYLGIKRVRKRPSGRYQARITVLGKTVTLGTFNTPAEAHNAYKTAANNNFGEFSRAS